MQRKGKIKYKNIRKKLHSIPIMSVKSNVLYSIPGVIAAAFLLGIFISLTQANNVHAIMCNDPATTDSGTISPITATGSPNTDPATVSLSLSTPSMVSSLASPGDLATVSTNVTVNVGNADSYSLNLRVNSTTMINDDTTIVAGNAVSDNTWGYSWDGASSYTAPTTGGTNLAVPTLSNHATNFTKTLTFGTKFADDAEPGHYTASGILSLVASPSTAMKYTLADLTQMQQLSLAPDACANTPYLPGLNYSAEYTLTDVRDGKTYTVRKLGDGKCWMTQNLALSTDSCNGRELKSTTSDVDTTWYLPISQTSGFSDGAVANTYLGADAKGVATGYYTWCAATAGTCPSSGTASASICPKGWRLPGGYGDRTYGNEFYSLFAKMNLDASDSLSSNGYTSWDTADLAKAQTSPYNFNFTGDITNGSYNNPYSNQYGFWWSGTTHGNNLSYRLYFNSGIFFPGTYNGDRFNGLAIRCIAQ